MKLEEIKPLLSDMRKNNVTKDKFTFTYNQVNFEVIVLIDCQPFELLFGVVGHNFSFILNLYPGFQLQNLPDHVFFKLCEILNLKPGKDTFTSFAFLKYMASKIPNQYSRVNIQPHEIIPYKAKDITDAEKIYFCGWKMYREDSPYSAKNFEKTRKILGESTFIFCKEHNISSCWTNEVEKRKDYTPPEIT